MKPRRRRSTGAPRGRGESGGAVTLMVMLMVPVCVTAAVVAAAVPKRLAAQAAADAAADNLASLAVAWRDAQARHHGPLDWFFADCSPADRRSPSSDAAPGAGQDTVPGAQGDPARTGQVSRDDAMRNACETLTRSLLAGLSARGFDADTVGGFHTGSYTTAERAETPDGEHPASVPCRAGGRAVVADAVHLGLTAQWATTDWAAAQTWPGGITIASEAIGTVTTPADGSPADVPACANLLRLDPPGTDGTGGDPARRFAESLPTRTAFGR